MDKSRNRKEERNEIKVRILEEASRAFCEKGIRPVTMDDIANALSISKRTLYEIYNDKEELLLEVVKTHSQETQQFIKEVYQKSENVLEVILVLYERNVEEFKKINKRFFEDMNKYPSVIKFIKKTRDEMASMALECFNEGIRQGIFRDDVNYEIIRVAMMEEMDFLLQSKLSDKYPLVDIYQNIAFMHLRGVSTEKGLTIVNKFLEQIK